MAAGRVEEGRVEAAVWSPFMSRAARCALSRGYYIFVLPLYTNFHLDVQVSVFQWDYMRIRPSGNLFSREGIGSH